MVTKGQINHTATTRNISERRSQPSHQGAETGENMSSWNTYNHSYSLKAGQQRTAQPPLKTSFYEDEYKKMVSRMDSEKVVSHENWNSSDPFGELLQLSVLADEGYRGGRSRDLGFVHNLAPTAPPPWKRKSRVSIHSLLKWKHYQDEKHELFMKMMRQLEMKDIQRFEHMQLMRKQRKMVQEEFTDSPSGEDFRAGNTHEQREGDLSMSNTSENSSMNLVPEADFMGSSGLDEDFKMGGIPEKDFRKGPTSLEEKQVCTSKQKAQKSFTKNGKVSPCRHFTKGWCRQGDACSFQHSVEGSYPDSWKVFLGGLPHSITPAKLLWELEQQGYMVVNQPKIFRGFSPQVCLNSESEAKKLLQVGKIIICGCTVDVRPYKASTKKERDRQLDTNNRSIFLGGLPSSVTIQILKAEIERLGMKVTNRPLIKAGFIPRVTLASADQAQELIAKGTININGAVVSVRPYVSKNKSN
jgi:hypothetical protein